MTTNYEKIKNMKVDELSVTLDKINKSPCMFCKTCQSCGINKMRQIKEWLESEVANDK